MNEKREKMKKMKKKENDSSNAYIEIKFKIWY
jgi:hypothetical protein